MLRRYEASAPSARVCRRCGRIMDNASLPRARETLEHAVDDGLIDEKDNPASKVPKPRRLPRVPVAVPGAAEVWSGWVGIAQQRAGLRILPGMVMVGKTGGCRP